MKGLKNYKISGADFQELRELMAFIDGAGNDKQASAISKVIGILDKLSEKRAETRKEESAEEKFHE